MRVSVRKDDPGYKNYAKWIGCTVYVNGKVVEHVFTADTDAGMVVCADTGPDGRVLICGDEVAERVVYGKVELRK